MDSFNKLRIWVICLIFLAAVSSINSAFNQSAPKSPEGTCVKNVTAVVAGRYRQPKKVQFWQGSIFCLFDDPEKPKLFRLDPSGMQFSPTKMISEEKVPLNVHVDELGRIFIVSRKNDDYFIDCFQNDKHWEIPLPPPLEKEQRRQISLGMCDSNLIVLEKNRIMRWDWMGAAPILQPEKSFSPVIENSTPEMLGSKDGFIYVKRTNQKIDQVFPFSGDSHSWFELAPMEYSRGSQKFYGASLFHLIAQVSKKKTLWITKAILSDASSEEAELYCYENKNWRLVSSVSPTKSSNWNFPPTSFRGIAFDANDVPILLTNHEGFFKMEGGSWKRLCKPNIFDLQQGYILESLPNGTICLVAAKKKLDNADSMDDPNYAMMILDPKKNEY